MASIDQVQSSGPYECPIPPKNSNFRIVENRIVIDAPHTTVFDFVTNWANLNKWLPVAANTKTLKGQENVPATMGDVLYESITDHTKDSEGNTPPSKVYTVVVTVPGVYWVVVGTDEGDSWYRWVGHFHTIPLEGNKTLFCRVFEQTCKDPSEPFSPAVDFATMEKGMKLLKEAIESGK